MSLENTSTQTRATSAVYLLVPLATIICGISLSSSGSEKVFVYVQLLRSLFVGD